MIIEIRLLARLLRIPLLRVEGVVAIRDAAGVGRGTGSRRTDDVPTPVVEARVRDVPGRRAAASPVGALGRDLAAAEEIVAELDAAQRRTRRGPLDRPDGR